MWGSSGRTYVKASSAGRLKPNRMIPRISSALARHIAPVQSAASAEKSGEKEPDSGLSDQSSDKNSSDEAAPTKPAPPHRGILKIVPDAPPVAHETPPEGVTHTFMAILKSLDLLKQRSVPASKVPGILRRLKAQNKKGRTGKGIVLDYKY